MNSDASTVLSAGALTSLTIEFIKWLVRNVILKKPEFDFPPVFYNLSLPFISALWGIALFYMGIGDGQLLEWKSLLEWFLSIVIALATYYLVNKPYKQYVRDYKVSKG